MFEKLEARYQGITAKVLKGCAVTLNLEYVDLEMEEGEWEGEAGKEVISKESDEVGIIPPVSSG